MREEIPSENRAKASRFADQNEVPKDQNRSNVKGNINFSRMKSHIVKGFSAADKKTKTRVLQTTAQVKKPPLNTSEIANTKNQTLAPNSRIKRSLIADLSCSINATQVHPQAVHNHSKTKSIGSSEDLFHEIDHLRNLLQESKDRELSLQAELSEFKKKSKKSEFEKELELKKVEIDGLLKRVELLEKEKANLAGHDSASSVEFEVVELRRLNMELQLQKRNLACRITSLESQLATITKLSESDVLEKIKAEASLLKHTNEDLCKQVEGLQISRMNEVEEIAYLRWLNSCLRDELRGFSNIACDKLSTPNPVDKRMESICFSSFKIDEDFYDISIKRLYLVRKFKKWPITDKDLHQMKYSNWDDQPTSGIRHSISGISCSQEDLVLNKKRKSDSLMCSKRKSDKRAEVLVSQKYMIGS